MVKPATRAASLADHEAIRRVVDAAFGGPAESAIIDGVRADGAALADLVAEAASGEVVGHVLLSRMTTPGDPDRFIAALGPVAVRPDAQNQGVGEALCRAGIAAMGDLGAEAVVVLGHPAYYPRFGFSHEAAKRLASVYASHGEAFMALELKPGALAEPLAVGYPAAFG